MFGYSWTQIVLCGVLVAVAVLASTGVLVLIVARLPESYFDEQPAACVPRDRISRVAWLALLGRNVAGILLVLVGIVLAIPGVPGPGLLTILIGVAITDFPGKHRLARWLVLRPGVLPALNRLRARLGKPPLILRPTADRCDDPPEQAPE